MSNFNPKEHLMSIKGKEYLPVAWRIVWMREEHKDWSINTEIVQLKDGGAVFKATISDETGRVLATAHKSETKAGFGDYMEKAETGSIGRCLGMCGYGTQFEPEFEEGDRLADSPVEKPVESRVEPEMGIEILRNEYLKVAEELGMNSLSAKKFARDKLDIAKFDDISETKLEYFTKALRQKLKSKGKSEFENLMDQIDGKV